MPTKKELYSLTKEMLFAKYNGLCAFCGYDLGDKWHIWEIEAGKTLVTKSHGLVLGNESYENKLPACISCNSTRMHSKRDGLNINIEQFRDVLYHEFDFMKNYSMTSTYYKKAIKFGLLQETGKKIVFYFETLTP